ncbi:hypothetical protein D9M71_619730 [compost metagenome]
MRDGEWHTRQNVVDGQAALQGLGAAGVLQSVVQHNLRQRYGAVSRVDINAERGKALGQLSRGGSEHALVFVDVLTIDHQQRLFAGKGVRTHGVARFETGRRGGQATGVGRNRSIGIGGLFSAYQSQAGAELGSFLGGYCRLRMCAQRHGHGSGQQSFDEFHVVVLLLSI